MRKKRKYIKSKKNIIYKKCGAISCINNIYGLCDIDSCELYENILVQED